MSPQLVDFDNDGNLDILSGSYAPGEIFFFKNRGDSTFARPKRLREKDNSVITVGAGTTAAAIDFDNDGDMDVLIGTMAGQVFLVTNTGTKDKPVFAAPTMLLIHGKSVQTVANAAPAVGDWDGDGSQDLLLGSADGSVVLYRATGRNESGAPRFADPKTLIPASIGTVDLEDAASQVRSRPWGGNVRVTIADFNGDSRPDILMGDQSVELVVNDGLTADQEKERVASDKDFRDAELAYRNVVTTVTAQASMTKSDNPSSCDFSKDPRVIASREKMEAAQEKRQGFYSAFKSHGYVWLFARKPSAQAGATK
jgi:hypothetical protein